MTRLPALDPNEPRTFDLRVGGPSALLVGKLHKLADRGGERGATRLQDKDALDVLRLLRAVPLQVLARGLQDLLAQPIASEVTAEACQHLRALFGTTRAPATVMAVRATEGLENAGTIAESCVALTDDLLGALRS